MWRDSESKEDFLNFTEVADQIVALVTNPVLLPISVGVFGGWGTGKSTVLKLVEGRLPKKDMGEDSKDLIVVHFDAWLYQGFDDSRTALMEVVSSELIKAAEKDKTFIDKAIKLAGRINYFRAIGVAAEFGIGMALGIPPGLLTTAGSALSNIFSEKKDKEENIKLTGELKSESVDVYKNLTEIIKPSEKKTPPHEIEEFRKEFSEILTGLNTTLILFIDNLDRCLPDVAIGTLEAVRLFLFMPRTAFVIAADEGMIRHSVAKHFNDPQASHVRDYLDKVIQVPLRVPQVGVEDLRAYMYSLFVSLNAPDKLLEVQKFLLGALQASWTGNSFDKEEISDMAGEPPELLENLAIADRLAPILATAPNIQGNPRIVKRLLNAIFLRKLLAKNRSMNVDLATLAKLAIFERCTDEIATLKLFRLILENNDNDKYFLPPEHTKSKEAEFPEEWNSHKEFIIRWKSLEPFFNKSVNLKPAVFLSRDVMAPARSHSDLSILAKDSISALLKVDNINSPVAKEIVKKLSSQDCQVVMSNLIAEMRRADLSISTDGIHGAIILSGVSSDAAKELKAFVQSLSLEKVDKGIIYVLKSSKLLERN